MRYFLRRTILGAAVVASLAACGGSSEEPLNIDYSALQIAQPSESPLSSPRDAEQFLRSVRNGLRLSVRNSVEIASADAQATAGITAYSATNVQIDGVDEADRVKYDGRYIYAVHRKSTQQSGTLSITRNALKIFRTNPESAGVEDISEFELAGEQSIDPQIYGVQAESGGTKYIAAISQDYRSWFDASNPLATMLALWPDHITIQLLDVNDPTAVSQAWKLDMDGWLKASRRIGDTLYLVSNYRPRLSGLVLPADTIADRQANERRIRDADATELLPGYRENDGAKRPLVRPGDCVMPADLGSDEGYMDLLIVTAISLSEQRVTDVTCLSTNVNTVYAAPQSLYIAGSIYSQTGDSERTVLHKFTLDDGSISYRATGAVAGGISWTHPSYYMDEYEGDLRILTTQRSGSSPTHHLTVLREAGAGSLQQLSALPNAQRPEPIGKPGETVWAVRFFAERAYVVTARTFDPLYIVDLKNPADPVLAGQLVIPGVSTYLRPLGTLDSQVLLSVGRRMDESGRAQGVKVELFDVRDAANPRSLGVQLLGGTNAYSDAFNDPHALTFLEVPGSPGVHRIALQVTDYLEPDWFAGVHLLEVQGVGSETPQLHLQGMLKTTPGAALYSLDRTRSVLHGESVFAVSGNQVVSSLWGNVQND